MSSGPMVSIAFDLERDEDGYPPFSVERLDVLSLAEGVGKIASIPFFVRGLSRSDTIAYALPDEFLELLSPRGESTLRIIPLDHVDGAGFTTEIERCGGELAFHDGTSVTAVSVPRSADFVGIHPYVQDGFARGCPYAVVLGTPIDDAVITPARAKFLL